MNYLVIGAGISGSSAARLLSKEKHHVRIFDSKPINPNLKHELEQLNIEIFDEDKQDGALKNIDKIVVSPGFPPEHPLLQTARQQSIPIISEVDLALEFFKGTIIGITGTNGKSTTCKMIEHIMQAKGLKAVACGNIGVPPCERIFQDANDDYWVMELSSYQLEISKPIPAYVGIFTSFSEDHLARHKSMENYFFAKWKLFNKTNQIKITTSDVFSFAKSFNIHVELDDFKIIDEPLTLDYSKLPLITKHDRLNASFAVSAVQTFLPEPSQSLLDTLKNFNTLPHRYEKVKTSSTFNIINDSKSTNFDSVKRALDSTHGACTLMIGGQSKGESFEDLVTYKDQIKQLICFGESGNKLKAELSSHFHCELFATLKDALLYLKSNPELLKDTVLFSPGCASFDEFKNFEERGEFFKSEMLRAYK